jgi:hypothetical protein
MTTKILSWDEYMPSKGLPKLLDVSDMIKHHVNKEAEVLCQREALPLPKYEKKEIRFTPASAVGLAGTMFKQLIP